MTASEQRENPLRDGPLRRTLEVLHLTSIGLWLGIVVMSGVVAAVMFTVMPDLRPALPDYALLPPEEQATLAAGHLQNQIFLVADVFQFVLGLLALGSLIGLLTVCKLPVRRISSAVRMIGLGVALGLFSYHLMVLAPSMQTELTLYQAAARDGMLDLAAQHRENFRADHPTASRVLTGIAVGLLSTMVGAAYSVASLGGDET